MEQQLKITGFGSEGHQSNSYKAEIDKDGDYDKEFKKATKLIDKLGNKFEQGKKLSKKNRKKLKKANETIGKIKKLLTNHLKEHKEAEDAGLISIILSDCSASEREKALQLLLKGAN